MQFLSEREKDCEYHTHGNYRNIFERLEFLTEKWFIVYILASSESSDFLIVLYSLFLKQSGCLGNDVEMNDKETVINKVIIQYSWLVTWENGRECKINYVI